MRGLAFLFVLAIIIFRKWVIFQKLFSIKLYYFPMFGSNIFCCCWETRLGTILDFIHKTQWTSNKTKWAISLGRSSNHTYSLVQHLAFFVRAPTTILFGRKVKWVEKQFSNSPYLACCEIELFYKRNKWIIISKIKPLLCWPKIVFYSLIFCMLSNTGKYTENYFYIRFLIETNKRKKVFFLFSLSLKRTTEVNWKGEKVKNGSMLTKNSFSFIIFFFMLSNSKKYKKLFLYKIFHWNKQRKKNVFFLSPLSQKK